MPWTATACHVLALAATAATTSESGTHSQNPDQYNTVVTAQHDDVEQTAASDRHIDAEIVRALPHRSGDDLLRAAPGALVVQHGSEGKGLQLYLRGFDAAHGSDVEVMVAGVPVNELSNVHGNGYVDLGFVMPETVRTVRVHKGPFRPEQGGFAMAASMELQLAAPAERRGLSVTYETGACNRHRPVILWAPPQGRGASTTFVAAEVLRDDGYGANRHSERAGFTGQALLLQSARLGRVVVLGTLYGARFGLPGAVRRQDVNDGLVALRGSYNTHNTGESRRGLLALHHRRVWPRNVVHTVAYGGWRQMGLTDNFTGFLLDAVNGDRWRQQHEAVSLGVRTQWRRLVAEPLRLDAGLSWQADSLGQREDHVDQAGRLVLRARSLAGTQHAASLYAGLTWKPPLPSTRRLRVSAGGRMDLAYYDVRDRNDGGARQASALWQPSPRLSLALTPWSAWTFYAAYGRGLRLPEARALTASRAGQENVAHDRYDGGAPRITTADALEAGLRWSLDRTLAASVAGFATFIERECVFDHVSGVTLELNGTRRLGVEIGVEARPLPWATLLADATYVQARFARSGAPVPGAPRGLASLVLVAGTQHGAFGSVRGLWVGPRPLAHGARAGGGARVDVGLGWRWPRAEVGLLLDNASSSDWTDGEYHYASRWGEQEATDKLPVIHQAAGPPLTIRVYVTARL